MRRKKMGGWEMEVWSGRERGREEKGGRGGKVGEVVREEERNSGGSVKLQVSEWDK